MKPSTARKGRGTAVPLRYVPTALSHADAQAQARMLRRSRRLYRQGQYVARKPVASFRNRTSRHVKRAQTVYGVDHVVPGPGSAEQPGLLRLPELARATGCSVKALSQIVRKGEGAYYSSGSRPNQTAQSWGIARLASALTAGKAAAVDYGILDKGCNHRKTAFQLAKQARAKYGTGRGRTRKVRI